MIEKRQGYFQIQLLFLGLRIFRGGNVFPESVKIAVFVVVMSIGF